MSRKELELTVIRSMIKLNPVTTDEEYEGAMKLAQLILGLSESEVADLIFDGPKKPEKDPDKEDDNNMLLWNTLKDHIGHELSIVKYGKDPDDPFDICLEDEDTGSVILDAEIYTICARSDLE